MTAILNVVLPVFGIVVAGYLCGRFKVLGGESSEALNRFVYYVAMPALFFVSMAGVELAVIFNGPFLTAVVGGMASVFVLAVVVARFAFRDRLGVLGLHGLTAIFANTGYMGIPLLTVTFGTEGTLAGVIATVFQGAFVIAAGAVILEIDLSGGGFRQVARSAGLGVAKNPLLVAAVIGLLVSALALPIPAFLDRFCTILSNAAGPCALFAMGLFMAAHSFNTGFAEVGWLTTLKLIVHPLVTWILAYHVVDLDPTWAASAVLLSALPTGALVFVLAQQYDVYVQRATAAIMVSTVLSLLTLSALFLFLGIA